MLSHAITREQQRSIPDDVIDLILKFGQAQKRPGRAMEYRIARRQINRIVGELRRHIRLLEKTQNKAVLVDGSESTVITVYVHR